MAVAAYVAEEFDPSPETEVDRRLGAARFMGPLFPSERLDFYALSTGPIAAAAMGKMNADWHLALAVRDLGALEAILVAAPLLEDRIHDRLGAPASG